MWSAPRQTAPNVDCSTRWIYANQGMSAYTGRMKNPFRKDPTHNLETTVASLTTRGEQLVAKRATAQLAFDKAIKLASTRCFRATLMTSAPCTLCRASWIRQHQP